jgi:signal transduction histidine kinase/HAMP domain-containing protein
MLRFRLLRQFLAIFGILAGIIVVKNLLLLHELSLGGAEQLRDARTVIIFGTVLILTFLLLSYLLVTRLLSDRLERILKAMEDVRKGDYPRLLVTGQDELADLTRGFNQMVEELRGRDDKLKTWVGSRETELVRLSQTLEIERGKLQTVLQSIGEGVLVLDTDNNVLMANRRVADIFGMPPEAMQGTDLGTLVDRVRHRLVNPEMVDRQFQELERNTGAVDEITLELDQGEQSIRLYSAPVRGANGKLFGRIATSLDVGRERDLERLKSEFLSTISHELRTPLTSIKGALGLIRSGAVGPVAADLRELLDIAVTNTDRLIRTINDLLDITQLEHGRAKMHAVAVSLKPSVELAARAVAVQGEHRRIELQVNVPDDLPMVLADRPRVEQVLIHLLSNAIKFSSPGGRVVLTAAPQDGAVLVSVQDFGVGISKEFQARVFEKFEHQEGALTRESQGVGLGLAISREIIEAHGGRIWVETQLGQGSTFYFTLPTAQPVAAGATETSRPGGAGPQGAPGQALDQGTGGIPG